MRDVGRVPFTLTKTVDKYVVVMKMVAPDDTGDALLCVLATFSTEDDAKRYSQDTAAAHYEAHDVHVTDTCRFNYITAATAKETMYRHQILSDIMAHPSKEKTMIEALRAADETQQDVASKTVV